MSGLVKSNCAFCGKQTFTFPVNQRGDLKTTFCGKVCEANFKYEKRFLDYDRK